MLIRLARKLAIWHSIDRQNRLQILSSVPIYGRDLRSSISIPLLGFDLFDSKKFKYVNHKTYKLKPTWSNSDPLYQMAQTVLNPACGYDPSAPRSVIITDWEWQSEEEIDVINSSNMLIKEITC